jgi:hypothetical protein
MPGPSKKLEGSLVDMLILTLEDTRSGFLFS